MDYINPSAKLAIKMYKLSKNELKYILNECNKTFEIQKKIDKKKEKEILEERIIEERNQLLFDY
jgi:hypothetical protein